MSVKSFADVHAVLAHYVPLVRSVREAYKLDRMEPLMRALGNPQESFRTIHIAGTSGKTSTAHYAAALLTQAGLKVGMTVSPHIDEVNERVQINMEPLSEQEFCSLFEEFMSVVHEVTVKPTYFELLVAFAYWVFAKRQVDYAVVEVGLGGLLDSTNIIARHDKVCVITDIGFDHMHVLGKTIQAIAAQKAGIIQPHNTVFTYEQEDAVMEVIREVCAQQQAELHELWQLPDKELPTNLPLFQRRNWYLALSACEYVLSRDDHPPLDETQLAISTTITIPARLETWRIGRKTVIMDGAHNPQKMHALVTSLRAMYPDKSLAFLVGMVQNKNARVKGSVSALATLADHVIITSFDVEDDLRKVSMNPVKIAEAFHGAGFDSWQTIAEPKDALAALLRRTEDVLVITGSFYLLGYMRELLAYKKAATR